MTLRINDNGVDRNMTAEEEAAHNEVIASAITDDQARMALIENATAAKESAKAKLAALGLTEDEVNAIIGGV